ncbi:MAG: TlpA family protein disulfide reductase [Pyrinomonadaceae bacterium]
MTKLALIFGLVAAYFSGCGTATEINSPVGPETAGQNSRPKKGTAIGDIAPEFNLPKVDGSNISSNELQGKPAVLVFWTAWCPVCKEEAPRINQLAEEFSPKGLQVVGINIGESDARIAEGIKSFGIKYTVAKDTDTSVSKAYKVIGTPTIVFLDKTGRIEFFGNEIPKDYADRLNRIISS